MSKRQSMSGKKNPSFSHGHATGDKVSPTYTTWRSMTNRCRDPKSFGWSRYGGRGISVCARWLAFESFLADMGNRPKGKTLDRINNDGNYEPGNCRWATRSEQMKNRDISTFVRGERHHQSKLTAQQVRDIRANYALCRVTLKELAERYRISVSQTHNITSGKHWRGA
jgi:hypothetical protein